MSDTPRQSPLVPPADWLRDRTPGSGPGVRFLLAVTALAAVLRLYGLTSQSLWVDEIMTWVRIRPGAGLHLLEQLRDNIQGPLYLAVVWPLVRLADNELMLRLPAAVAGILTVPLFGRVAGRLVDARAARFAVLLLAISPFHVWYSQEARGYAFLLFFAVLAAWCWLAMVRRGPTPGLAALLALACAGAVWSNMSGVFLWVALALTIPATRPAGWREWRLWLVALGGGFLAALPWLSQAAGIWAVERIVPGASTGEALRGATTFSPAALPYTLYSLTYGYSLGPSLRALHAADRLAVLGPWLPLLVTAALPLALGLPASLRPFRRRTLLLLVWTAVPWLLLMLLASRNIKPWNARYVALTLPWLLLLLAHGTFRLPRRLGAVVGGVVCLLMLVSVFSLHGVARYAKEDVRAAAAVVAAGDGSGGAPAETVLVPTVTGVYRYYDRRSTDIIASWGQPPLRDAADADRYLAEALAGRDRAWVVLAREWFLDPRGLLVPALERLGDVQPRATATGVRVLFWTRRAAPPGSVHGG
jgi:hypothetical protein